ncbi:prolyl oligopeptidase family serine peptidase [bacterium]|nr:prolyl oligopeptidase family serine peptidase [bacterium]
MKISSSIIGLTFLFVSVVTCPGAEKSSAVDQLWKNYFAEETKQLSNRCLADIQSKSDWEKRAPEYRRELREMLGLDPWPERTPLNPVVTGTIDHGDFKVEKLYFQSMPGLYVTANLYLPETITNRLPAILYVCGHGPSKKNGVSYGNKVTYQHHGAWFARQGYVCLLIDTIQLGEIEGIHHGTYREGMWWWNSRGYTPAGVEAWNSIRAIDYLQTRPEVDPERIGMTGRSGGGAYTWWTAAIDERVKVAAPVAGITDLHNHVVDGTVEGHCDCMFMVNTYRWDYPQVAALVAPRPLMIGNTDRDTIFPLDGVERVHRQVARIYKLLNAETNLTVLITEGPHHDSQELRVPVMHWFNRFLKSEDPLIRIAADKFFEPEQLKVFDKLPADQIVTTIHESFVPKAPPPRLPTDRAEWNRMTKNWRKQMMKKVFAGWPAVSTSPVVTKITDKETQSAHVRVLQLETQPGMSMPLVILEPRGNAKKDVELRVLDHADWQAAATAITHRFGIDSLVSPVNQTNESTEPTADAAIPNELDHTLVLFAPRGAGLTAPDLDARSFIQFRRRFMLLGQTLDGMRVWDIRQAARVLDREFDFDRHPLTILASGKMAVNTVLAEAVEPRARKLSLHHLPAEIRDGPDYLNILKVANLPALLAMTTDETGIDLELTRSDSSLLEYGNSVKRQLSKSEAR